MSHFIFHLTMFKFRVEQKYNPVPITVGNTIMLQKTEGKKKSNSTNLTGDTLEVKIHSFRYFIFPYNPYYIFTPYNSHIS